MRLVLFYMAAKGLISKVRFGNKQS